MKIEIDTKFDIGDEVWFMDGIRPTKGAIKEIKVHERLICDSNDCEFNLLLKVEAIHGLLWQYPDEVFATKRELVESLMDKGDKEE